jgi:hypothetical protein
VTTTNGRDQATAILSGTDALVAAAEAAQRATVGLGNLQRMPPDLLNEERQVLMYEVAQLAQVAEGLSVYAATVGEWATR